MKTIAVDFDVYTALTTRSAREGVTNSDVLRELLKLPEYKKGSSPLSVGPASGDWVVKGVRIPLGTEFQATYKGQTYRARIENGALILNGKRYDTPSAAAVSITKMTVNGWLFWKCRTPGQSSWMALRMLRK